MECLVEGGITGPANMADDPIFVDAEDPKGPDGLFGTADDGLHLAPWSPGVNAGRMDIETIDLGDLDADGDVAETIALTLDWSDSDSDTTSAQEPVPIDFAYQRREVNEVDIGAYETQPNVD